MVADILTLQNYFWIANALDILPQIPSETVQMVILDPPYGLNIVNKIDRPEGGQYAGMANVVWDQFPSIEAWIEFFSSVLVECRRILKPDGTIAVFGTYHNIYAAGFTMRQLGWWVLNEIVWHKTNPAPNFRGVRFTTSHENIIWACKGEKSKYKFNYQAIKAHNGGTQMHDVWDLPTCRGKERLVDPVTKRILHPTQKPEEIIRRLLIAGTDEGDLVVDPFGGVGTTAAVARKLGRNWISCDLDQVYAAAALHRIYGV